MFARSRQPLALLVLLSLALVVGAVRGDGPGDNVPDNVRRIPPLGIELLPPDAAEVKAGLAELQSLLKDLGKHELLPDVEVYEKAVRYAVSYREVFDAKGTPAVKKVLKEGLDRARALKEGKHPWTSQTGPVLRGYRSRIDGSSQPYWLIVPKEYDFAGKMRHRLDFWWHGRGETISEANFMANPANASGIIPAPGAFILHPYGRYCNANKFAGEIDTFEALEHAKKQYRIDESRLVARGFSMGGAACWQYAVHYPTLWAAAAPGAGFAETPEFLNVFQNEKVEPTWYEKKLWRMYNATDYAQNVFNLPTVAYSGEIDRQKQAADVMAREMKKVGLELVHIIGPKTGHSYEKGAKEEVNRRIDEIVMKGKPDVPREIKFVTYTLRYNRCGWVTIEGLGQHWEAARVNGKLTDGSAVLTTENVTALTLSFPNPDTRTATIDGTQIPLTKGGPTGSVTHARKAAGKWQAVASLEVNALRKFPGLQGPIDDAFMDAFIMVRPTGKPLSEKTGKWVEAELQHAITHWRQQFRGDVRIKNDTDITEDDIRNNNLVLWGDPQSNKLIAKMAGNLPVTWANRGLTVGDKTYDGDTHVPALIYPNPLNLQRYVVLNSGFTYREYDYLNNARQVPKLPDYAVIDVTTPPNSRYPGKVVRAGFYDEQWQLAPNDGK